MPTAAAETDASLIDRVRRADTDALSDLYRVHAGSLLRTLTALLGNRADAEDALHDLFVGLPEALHHYREQGTLRSWLGAIAVRLALMRLRTRRRRREVALDDAARSITPPDAESAGDVTLVRHAVARLPEKLRVVVVLRHLEEWSYTEISRHIGVSEGALMARHSRAMKRLRQALERNP